MMQRSPMILGVVIGIVTIGCTTLPTEVAVGPGVRVLSYSMEKAVRLGSLNGPAEEKPGLISSRQESFDTPLRQALDLGWAAFSNQALPLGVSNWQGPGDPADHPAWVASSSDPIPALSFDVSRARGYYWPQEFRYVAPDANLSSVAVEYPGELLLTVEYRVFTEDVGEKTDFRYPDYRLGVWASFRLYSNAGTLILERQVVGRSAQTRSRVGDQIDRRQFPGLFLEAQADALRQWAKTVNFRTGS